MFQCCYRCLVHPLCNKPCEKYNKHMIGLKYPIIFANWIWEKNELIDSKKFEIFLTWILNRFFIVPYYLIFIGKPRPTLGPERKTKVDHRLGTWCDNLLNN